MGCPPRRSSSSSPGPDPSPAAPRPTGRSRWHGWTPPPPSRPPGPVPWRARPRDQAAPQQPRESHQGVRACPHGGLLVPGACAAPGDDDACPGLVGEPRDPWSAPVPARHQHQEEPDDAGDCDQRPPTVHRDQRHRRDQQRPQPGQHTQADQQRNDARARQHHRRPAASLLRDLGELTHGAPPGHRPRCARRGRAPAPRCRRRRGRARSTGS